MKRKIIGYCLNCQNQSFRFVKKVEGKSEDSILISETLMHDGFGFDLNTFDIICSKCGKKDTDRFKFENKKKPKLLKPSKFGFLPVLVGKNIIEKK